LTEEGITKESLRQAQDLVAACAQALGFNEATAKVVDEKEFVSTAPAHEAKEPQFVLVANDDAVVRGLLCSLLRDGAVVVTARTGEEALARY
jgi:hypothetical protein